MGHEGWLLQDSSVFITKNCEESNLRSTEVCLAGGLGNQLFQYAAAVSLSNPEDEIILNCGYGDVVLGFSGLPEIFEKMKELKVLYL